MATFKFDGKDIPFEKGDTIIRAATRAGVEVPHYCWHPGLSVAANCRMCLVEVDGPGQRTMMLDVLRWDAAKQDYVPEKKPKLQPSCQFPASEGLIVKSETSPNVALARKNVQEFLLLNHPVDCPICDQAGECMLQDYYMSEQRTAKRMRDEPNHKPKGVSFGPTIVYDAERCIACTRCIRFCEEVTQDPVLEMRERGNLFEISVSPGRELDGKYTMMTEFVCPVGALTTKAWRHKGRVWLLKSTPSVCSGCATGCNMYLDVDTREQTPFRVRPRENESVNKYWMCDDGMLSYQALVKNRVRSALSGRGENATELPLAEAFKKAANQLRDAGRKVAVLLSAQHSCEDNLVLAGLATQLQATMFLTGKPAWEGDKILRSSDQNPNRQGVLKLLGLESLPSAKDFAAKANNYSAVLALGTDTELNKDELAALGRIETVIVLTPRKGLLQSVATLTLPAASWAEAEGCYVNEQGKAQTFKRGMPATGDTKPAWDLAASLGRELNLELAYTRFAEVRAALVTRLGAAPEEPKRDVSVHPESSTPRAGL